MSRSRGLSTVLVTGAAWLSLSAAAQGVEPEPGAAAGHMHHTMSGADSATEHQEPGDSGGSVHRSVVAYATPEVNLVRDDGKRVSLPAELDDGRPVIMNFIYTTC
jgi:protein SCO1